MASWLATLERRAALRARAGLRRELRPRAPGDLTDLAGNDYLGFSHHPEVVAAAAAALSRYGLGATGSRLVGGTTAPLVSLEQAIAGWLGTEAALVYSSGYLANLGVLRALARPRTRFVLDAHAHASLVDGCRLAGAETVVVPHASAGAVDAAVRAHGGRDAVVVTESVFSVDGDLAPLPELYAVTRAHGAILMVDDAHGLGVLGPSGAGGVAGAGLAGSPDLVVTATLSKALGGAGGVVGGPAQLVRHLIDTSRTFIYDTGLPPPMAAGVAAAVRLARAGDDLRAELSLRARSASERLREAGLAASVPAAGVLAVRAPSASAAAAWAQACRDAGVAVGCFRPPSTPDSASRLRLTVNVSVPRPEFDRALDAVIRSAP